VQEASLLVETEDVIGVPPQLPPKAIADNAILYDSIGGVPHQLNEPATTQCAVATTAYY
jgi:hypothetical protein